MSEPSATELLQAVRKFMREELVPELDSFKSYNTRVAASALGIVARQIERQEKIEQLDREAMGALGLEGSHQLQRELSLRLKSCEIDFSNELFDYLRQRTMLQLSVDNPKYSGYEQALERWGETEFTSSTEE